MVLSLALTRMAVLWSEMSPARARAPRDPGRLQRRRAVGKVCAGCERQRARFREHGVVTWDTKIVTPTEVTDRLKALPPNDETRVMIAADENCLHHQVLAVMDAVRAAGIDKVSFETKNPR